MFISNVPNFGYAVDPIEFLVSTHVIVGITFSSETPTWPSSVTSYEKEGACSPSIAVCNIKISYKRYKCKSQKLYDSKVCFPCCLNNLSTVSNLFLCHFRDRNVHRNYMDSIERGKVSFRKVISVSSNHHQHLKIALIFDLRTKCQNLE